MSDQPRTQASIYLCPSCGRFLVAGRVEMPGFTLRVTCIEEGRSWQVTLPKADAVELKSTEPLSVGEQR